MNMTVNVAENVKAMIEQGLADTEEFALELVDAMIQGLVECGFDIVVEVA